MSVKTTKTPECKCPFCGHILTAATGTTVSPKEDDLSICVNCTALLIFNPDLILEAPSKEVLDSISLDEWLEIDLMQEQLKLMKEGKSIQ